jgi:hypothetical protein
MRLLLAYMLLGSYGLLLKFGRENAANRDAQRTALDAAGHSDAASGA